MSPRYRNPKYDLWQEVVDRLKPEMARAGFKRKKQTWYRYNRQVLQMIDVGMASSARRLILRLGIILRKLDRSIHPSFFDCHIRGQVQRFIPNKSEFDNAADLCAAELSADRTADVFSLCIQRHMLPLLDSARTVEEVRVFLTSDLGKKLFVDKVLREAIA